MGAFPQSGRPRGGRPWREPHARSQPSRDRVPWPPGLARRSGSLVPRNPRAPRSTPPWSDGRRPDGTRVQGPLAKQSTPALARHTRCRRRRPLRCELCHPDACPSVTQRDRRRETLGDRRQNPGAHGNGKPWHSRRWPDAATRPSREEKGLGLRAKRHRPCSQPQGPAGPGSTPLGKRFS